MFQRGGKSRGTFLKGILCGNRVRASVFCGKLGGGDLKKKIEEMRAV